MHTNQSPKSTRASCNRLILESWHKQAVTSRDKQSVYDKKEQQAVTNICEQLQLWFGHATQIMHIHRWEGVSLKMPQHKAISHRAAGAERDRFKALVSSNFLIFVTFSLLLNNYLERLIEEPGSCWRDSHCLSYGNVCTMLLQDRTLFFKHTPGSNVIRGRKCHGRLAVFPNGKRLKDHQATFFHQLSPQKLRS